MNRLAALTTVIGLLSATAGGAVEPGGQRPIHVGALLATPHQGEVVNDIQARVASNLATPAGQQAAESPQELAIPATFEGFPATVHQASSLGFAHARPHFKVR